ncbi:hypothetical protein Tco_1108074 [Tanacetum coccineum]
MKSRFLDSGGGGGKKKKSNANATSSSGLDSNFPSLSVVAGSVSSQDEGLNEGNIVTVGTTGQAANVVVVPRDMSATNTLVNADLNNYGSILSGPTSYAKVNGEPSRKSVIFLTLITSAGNGVDVVVPLESIRAISERFVDTAYGFFLGKRVAYPFSSVDGFDSMLENDMWFIRNNPLILKKWNSDVNLLKEDVKLCRVVIELQVNVELKDTIVVIMPKLVEQRVYTCTVRVEYEWKPPRPPAESDKIIYTKDLKFLRGNVFTPSPLRFPHKVFGHIEDECPKNIGSDVAKNLKNPSQAPKALSVGPKVGFKPVKQVYRLVFKKNNANTSGNKKKDAESRKEVSNPNPFDVLNLVENDVDLGSNGGGGLQMWLVKWPIIADPRS